MFSPKTRALMEYVQGIFWILYTCMIGAALFMKFETDGGFLMSGLKALLVFLYLGLLILLVPATWNARKKYRQHDFKELSEKLGVGNHGH